MPDHVWSNLSAHDYPSDLNPAGPAFESPPSNPDNRSEFQIVAAVDTSGEGSEALPVKRGCALGAYLSGPIPIFAPTLRRYSGRRVYSRLKRYSRARARYPISIRARPTGG